MTDDDWHASRKRAAHHLHRRRPLRPEAQSQAEALFDEPEHQEKRLVPIETWPDYRADD